MEGKSTNKNELGVALSLVLVGIAAIIGLGILFNIVLASRPSNSNDSLQDTYSSFSSPSNISSSSESSKSYIDSVTGLSFQFPADWDLAERIPGQSVRIVNPESSYYRGIELLMEENLTLQSSNEIDTQWLETKYGKNLAGLINMETFYTSKTNGTRLSGLSQQGIHAVYILKNNRFILTVSLIEGGGIGGGDSNDFPTANDDEQVMMSILETIEFSKP